MGDPVKASATLSLRFCPPERLEDRVCSFSSSPTSRSFFVTNGLDADGGFVQTGDGSSPRRWGFGHPRGGSSHHKGLDAGGGFAHTRGRSSSREVHQTNKQITPLIQRGYMYT